MTDLTVYETRVITPDITSDGRTVVLLFKPHQQPPVCIQIPRLHFERLLEKAATALSQAPLRDNA